MRKHGWQLPYHPLQVVAVAVFLALGFAYYVFFAPFLGKKLFQYISMGIYTPLIICVFSLYIWSAAADPADPGVFKSKKYLKIPENKKLSHYKKSNIGEESPSSLQYDDCPTAGGKSASKSQKGEFGQNIKAPSHSCWMKAILGFIPCALICQCSSSNGESSEYPHSEDGMFYCSLCEVEVSKYSKHCRVCDKCVHSFDHHCRWVNNCIGKRNYQQFFALMVSALLMLILQWSTGILVLICCFLEHKKFSLEISTNLGSSFTIVPFVVVVAVCTILAMIATLPIAQLFFFHILLIKKGISTYDYIIALREQEQQGVGGQQSPSMVSSITGISSASSVNTFQRGAWCTPPRLFLEDQFDVVPPDTGSVSSWGKKMAPEKEPIKKKNPAAVKISPWTLARLNADEVSKAAAEARKKSKILIPISKRGLPFVAQTESTFNNNHPMGIPKPERHFHKNTRNVFIPEASSSLAPLQAMNSSPDSSLESPRHLPFRVSSSGAEEACQLSVSRSASDGYDASGGEDSDRVPSRPVLRMSNWSNVLFHPNRDERVASSSQTNGRKF